MPTAQLPLDHACLIVHGTDSPGIVAAVSALITRQGANIVQFDQYSDNPAGGAYFQRVVFHRPGLREALPAIENDLATTLGDGFDLQWAITDQSVPKRMAILASKQDHCLLDLLWRHRRGELPVEILKNEKAGEIKAQIIERDGKIEAGLMIQRICGDFLLKVGHGAEILSLFGKVDHGLHGGNRRIAALGLRHHGKRLLGLVQQIGRAHV